MERINSDISIKDSIDYIYTNSPYYKHFFLFIILVAINEP